MNRDDFLMLDKDIVYFDNGATTFKPKYVVDKIVDYYSNYTANAHRGDYHISMLVDKAYEDVRVKVKNLISAEDEKEIVFTSGATDGLNMIVNGFMRNKLKAGDEVLLTKVEHASNVLPWMELEKSLGIVIKYIPLDDNFSVTVDNVRKSITSKTKIISLAHITNTVGDIRPVEEIGKLCLENNLYFVVDAAQSVPHMRVDVKKANISFLVFSGHKMLGPTGVGVLYGKLDLLEDLYPVRVGGGMNNFFLPDGEFEYTSLPNRLEAGTPNIAGVIGLGAAIDYLNNIGFDKIMKHEKELKEYFLEKIKKIPNVKVYNPNTESGIVLFNLEGIFAQDTAVFLDYYHICVRAGNHCAKMSNDELGIKNTCRISFYLYNTKEEIDKLIKALENSEHIFDIVI